MGCWSGRRHLCNQCTSARKTQRRFHRYGILFRKYCPILKQYDKNNFHQFLELEKTLIQFTLYPKGLFSNFRCHIFSRCNLTLMDEVMQKGISLHAVYLGLCWKLHLKAPVAPKIYMIQILEYSKPRNIQICFRGSVHWGFQVFKYPLVELIQLKIGTKQGLLEAYWEWTCTWKVNNTKCRNNTIAMQILRNSLVEIERN